MGFSQARGGPPPSRCRPAMGSRRWPCLRPVLSRHALCSAGVCASVDRSGMVEWTVRRRAVAAGHRADPCGCCSGWGACHRPTRTRSRVGSVGGAAFVSRLLLRPRRGARDTEAVRRSWRGAGGCPRRVGSPRSRGRASAAARPRRAHVRIRTSRERRPRADCQGRGVWYATTGKRHRVPSGPPSAHRPSQPFTASRHLPS